MISKDYSFVAAPIEESDSTPANSGLDALEESTSNADLASDDHSGLYIPNFLGEANNGEWGLMIRMASAIQVDEQQQKRCFVRVLTTLSEIAPRQKMYEGPCSRGGLPKQQWQQKPKYRHKPLHPLNWLLLRRRKLCERSPERTPCLNPDPFTCLIGPKNWGEAFIDDELTTCLLDNGAQLNFVTPDYAVK